MEEHFDQHEIAADKKQKDKMFQKHLNIYKQSEQNNSDGGRHTVITNSSTGSAESLRNR